MKDTKSEALSHLDEYSSVMLATIDEGGPHVRPVTLIKYDSAYWIETGTSSAKVAQIKGDPRIELCLVFTEGENSGYLRLAGRAKIVTDAATREKVSSHTEFFASYWSGPEDPSFTLLRVRPSAGEYMRPGEMEPQAFDL
ncbi:MAG TPA: hypothetical protein ENH11_01645 [Candidatus Acetothermia bacterium]|nr:hypothetical protein [Candidatus Acetothermia bacterium]